MAFRSEFEELAAERDRIAKRGQPKLPALERAAWLWRAKAPPATPDYFVWLDPFAAAPAIAEDAGT